MKYGCARAMNVPQIQTAPLTIANVNVLFYMRCRHKQQQHQNRNVKTDELEISHKYNIFIARVLNDRFIYGNRIRFQLHTR